MPGVLTQVEQDDSIEKLRGRELDVAVAERVMGLTLLGTAACDVDPECGRLEIVPLDEPQSGTVVEPVFLRRCYCANYPIVHVEYPDGPFKHIEIEANARNQAEHRMDLDRWGHSRACLDITPRYSSSIEAAKEVVNKMWQLGWQIEMANGYKLYTMVSENVCSWWVRFSNNENDMENWSADADSLEKAICLAALKTLESK